jgi:hypothetical protein
VKSAPRALLSGLLRGSVSKNEKRMVFIELARVSEIPAPHKFDRSIDIEKKFRSIELEIRSINFTAIPNLQLLCIFA